MAGKYVLSHSAKTRRLTWRYILLVGVLLLLAAILQVSFFARFRLMGATPDLMIVTVLCLAFFGGRHMGAVVGIAAGFLIDALGGTGIVLSPLLYLLVGYLAGHYAAGGSQRGLIRYLPYLGVTLIARAATTAILTVMTHGSLFFGELMLYTLLPEMLNTALAGLALYFPLRLFSAWVGRI